MNGGSRHKILKDLAWGLGSRGLAVYRYDKRTYVTELSSDERDIDMTVVNDAVAAARRLASVDGVRSDTIYVAGHSLGGILAPRIAATHGDLAGIALLDSRAQPIEEFLPLVAEEVQDAEWLTEDEREALQQRAQTAEQTPSEVASSKFAEYDQVETAQQLSLAMFVAHTGRLTPGAYRQSLEEWRTAIAADRLESVFYPDLNHYFYPGTRPAVQLEVHTFHENVAEPLIDELVSWIAGED